ncbi:MAG TPA: hypothetical protein VMV10_23605 [Pirellulales bacterium]|nr:hypothetical protein [Pirellulales bacterium]
MKLAMSALFALALLAGNTGCRFFCPCYACDRGTGGCTDDCGGGCGASGCGLGGGRACGCQVGPYGGGGIGCSRRLHIFNWSRCRDCCDECPHWTGEGFVSQTGGFHPRPNAGVPANFEETGAYDERGTYAEPEPEEPGSAGEPEPEQPQTSEPSARVVPGSTHITTRRADSELAEESVEDLQITERPRPITAAPRRGKRISSTRMK